MVIVPPEAFAHRFRQRVLCAHGMLDPGVQGRLSPTCQTADYEPQTLEGYPDSTRSAPWDDIDWKSRTTRGPRTLESRGRFRNERRLEITGATKMRTNAWDN